MDKTAFYLCFTLSHDEDLAAERFKQKCGKPPEVIEEDKGVLWVGPVPSVRAGGVKSALRIDTRGVGEGEKEVRSGQWEAGSENGNG